MISLDAKPGCRTAREGASCVAWPCICGCGARRARCERPTLTVYPLTSFRRTHLTPTPNCSALCRLVRVAASAQPLRRHVFLFRTAYVPHVVNVFPSRPTRAHLTLTHTREIFALSHGRHAKACMQKCAIVRWAPHVGRLSRESLVHRAARDTRRGLTALHHRRQAPPLRRASAP